MEQPVCLPCSHCGQQVDRDEPGCPRCGADLRVDVVLQRPPADAETSPAAGTLCLETTETALMENSQAAMETLVALHGLGVRVSMDDFGTGHRRYCWPVRSLSDLKFAPFRLLASAGGVHVGRDHVRHRRLWLESARPIPSCSSARRTASST